MGYYVRTKGMVTVTGEVHMMDADGSDQTNLTKSSAFDRGPF